MTELTISIAPARRKIGSRRVSTKKTASSTTTSTKRILKPKRRWNKTTLQKADDKFSLQIRKRDGHCLFPGCQSTENLQCSHYFGRAIKSTRFDPDNCITLCWFHHFKSKDLGYEYQKQRKEKQGWDGQYTLFMKKWLGKEKWLALIERSQVKMRPKEIKEMVYGIIDNLAAKLP